MFGKNKVSGPFNPTGDTLTVNEIFYTIQGEGPDAGRPAIFLRLSKCNLRCYFCDTEFEKGVDVPLENVLDEVLQLSKVNACSLLVITGGEPLLQNIVPLTSLVNAHGISVSIETAGVAPISGSLSAFFSPLRAINGNLIVCSPKTPKLNPQIVPLIGAYKYIIREGDIGIGGIPNKSTQMEGENSNLYFPTDPAVPIYVQAMDEGGDEANQRNLIEAARIAMKYGYRLSVQVHKLAGLR